MTLRVISTTIFEMLLIISAGTERKPLIYRNSKSGRATDVSYNRIIYNIVPDVFLEPYFIYQTADQILTCIRDGRATLQYSSITIPFPDSAFDQGVIERTKLSGQ